MQCSVNWLQLHSLPPVAQSFNAEWSTDWLARGWRGFCYIDLVKLCMTAASCSGLEEELQAAVLCPARGAE